MSRPFPRAITWREGMDSRALSTLLNEWTRDVAAWLGGEGVDLFLRPTRLIIDSYHAAPGECVRVVAEKKAMDVHLPPAADARGRCVGIVNVTSSTNTITIRCGKPTDTINGAETQTIADGYGARFLYSDGEDWFTVSDIGDEPSPPTGANALLWEWDGTLDQFEASESFGPGDTTLDVVARSDVPGGQCLRYERGILGAATPPGIWLVLASELTLPPRFEAEILVRECGTSSSGRGGGIAFYCDPDHSSGFHGYTWTFSGNGADSVSRVDAGTVSTASPYGTANALDTNAGGVARIAFEMVQGSGEVPRWVAHGEGRHPYTAGAVRMSTDAILGNTDLQYEQSISAAPSSWQTANPTRFGLAFTFVSNSLAIDYYEVAALRVYKHPRDL